MWEYWSVKYHDDTTYSQMVQGIEEASVTKYQYLIKWKVHGCLLYCYSVNFSMDMKKIFNVKCPSSWPQSLGVGGVSQPFIQNVCSPDNRHCSRKPLCPYISPLSLPPHGPNSSPPGLSLCSIITEQVHFMAFFYLASSSPGAWDVLGDSGWVVLLCVPSSIRHHAWPTGSTLQV